jgi:hypothetical protein
MNQTRRPAPLPSVPPDGIPTAILPRPDPVETAYALEIAARVKTSEAKLARDALDATQRHRLATRLMGGECRCGAFAIGGRRLCMLCEIEDAG